MQSCHSSPLPAAAPRTQLWGSDVVLRPPGWCMGLNPSKPCILTFKTRLEGVKIYLQPPNLSLLCKFPWLWNLPPANMEGPASLWSLPALCIWGLVSDHTWSLWTDSGKILGCFFLRLGQARMLTLTPSRQECTVPGSAVRKKNKRSRIFGKEKIKVNKSRWYQRRKLENITQPTVRLLECV